MASLGSIGVCRSMPNKLVLSIWAASNALALPSGRFLVRSLRKQNVWRYMDRNGIFSSSAGTISGSVVDGGSPVPYAIVRLYYRQNGVFIGGSRADSSGNFSISGLDPADSASYFCVAFDPDDGIQYNAVIYDRLTAS